MSYTPVLGSNWMSPKFIICTYLYYRINKNLVQNKNPTSAFLEEQHPSYKVVKSLIESQNAIFSCEDNCEIFYVFGAYLSKFHCKYKIKINFMILWFLKKL